MNNFEFKPSLIRFFKSHYFKNFCGGGSPDRCPPQNLILSSLFSTPYRQFSVKKIQTQLLNWFFSPWWPTSHTITYFLGTILFSNILSKLFRKILVLYSVMQNLKKKIFLYENKVLHALSAAQLYCQDWISRNSKK